MKRFGCQWERRTSFYETISNAIITILAVLILLFWPAAGRGDTTPSDDTAVFTNIAPDALLVLDLSTSMSWNPAGEHDSGNHPINKWGKTNACTDLSSYGGDYTVDCSRLAIAKRAIFNILDANSDATINSADSDYLNVRIGYMRFTNGDDTAGDYNSGNIQLIRPLGTSYSNIYCSNKTSCTITSGSSSSSCINGESANGGTPLASALNEAKLYLDDNKANDKTAGACRQKFVIVITDGADTYACGGNGTETQKTQYQRRREVVARTKALADAGYKVFVIGFGNGMPGYLQSTLNWMAYYGGTDNPTITNSGDTDGYSITTGLYPSGVSGACYAEPDASLSGTCDGTSTACFATTNDPGNLSLDGYAFLASSATDLSNALKAAITIIHESTYSFTQASVQSLRTKDENYLYEGSVGYIATDPFWRGHLKKYQINDDGTVGDVIWDAGDLLAAKSSDSRTMWTWKSGSRTLFTTSNITAADLGVTSAKDPETQRLKIIGFVRGDASYNLEGWKLGDIFHAPPVTIGSPSDFYNDVHDQNNAFAAFRTAHQRTSANGKRLVVAGANDDTVVC